MITMEAIVINSDSEDEKVPKNTETRTNPLPVCRACKGICGAPDTIAYLPPSTSPAYLEALYSRSKIRAPKRPMQTLVELFPVINDVNKEFRDMLGKEYTEANVMRFMQFYIRTMRTLQEQVHKYPNKCRALSRNVCRTLLLIKRMSTNVIEPTPYFMQKICELLAIYMFLELRYASSYSESKSKVVERIVNNFLLHLDSPDLTYILRIFAYIPFVGKEAYIVSRVFQRLIPIELSSSKHEFNDRLYVQYLIAFYHWKDAETLPNCQENVIALANEFMKPKRSLKSSVVYARHLPCYEKREHATRYFLTNLVFFNDLRNASLLDGVAVMVDETIDLSDEVDLLCTDYSELELNKNEPPKEVVKKEIVVPRIMGTVDLTKEEETPWLMSLARTARDRELNLSSIQRKPSPEVIELDSSDDELWAIRNYNFMAINRNDREKGLSDTDTDTVPFDMPEDSSSDVLIRAAIADNKNAFITNDDAPATERRLTFEGVLKAQQTGLTLTPFATIAASSGSSSGSSSPLFVSENVEPMVTEDISSKAGPSGRSPFAFSDVDPCENVKASTSASAIAAIACARALAASANACSSGASTSASAIAATKSATTIAAGTSGQSAVAAGTSPPSAIATGTSASPIGASTSASARALAASTSASPIASTSASAVVASKTATAIAASAANTNAASTSASAIAAKPITTKSSPSATANLSAGTSKSSSSNTCSMVNVNANTGTRASTSRACDIFIDDDMHASETEESVTVQDLAAPTEMAVETESEREAKGRALVADILTNFAEKAAEETSACSGIYTAELADAEPEPEPQTEPEPQPELELEPEPVPEAEQMEICIIGENTIDDSAAAPKEAVTLNLESYTSSFICNEDNDEFLRYYETMPPIKTYLRRPPKKPEVQVEKPVEVEKTPKRTVDERPATPAPPTLEVANEPVPEEIQVQPEAEVETIAPAAEEAAGEEDADEGELNPSQRESLEAGGQVLFSRKVISLREDDGGQTPGYLRVPESVEISSQGSNVVFSMQGRRLSSFPPLQVSSHEHAVPDFDADFFSEGEDTVAERPKETQVTIPAVTTFPKTIIKQHDVEKEKSTAKRRSVWFSDKNEVREIAPRDEFSEEFTTQSSSDDTSPSTNSPPNALKQQSLPSTSQQQQQKQQSTSTSTTSHQPSALNASKTQKSTATPTATATATATTSNNSNLLKKSKPPTTEPSTSTDTASLKSAQEKALLRELFPDLFVAAGKTETEVISEITDTLKTSAKSSAANNKKKLKKPASSQGKGARSSSSCSGYKSNQSCTEKARRQSTTPTLTKPQSDFDRYLHNLQTRKSRSKSQPTKDVTGNASSRQSSDGSRKQQFVPVKNIKSLVDITSDVKLNKLRTRVVLDRDYEDVFRALLMKNDSSSRVLTSTPLRVEVTPPTITVAERTAEPMDGATTMPESTPLPAVVGPTKEVVQQPEQVEKLSPTEYEVRPPEKPTNPPETMVRVPSRAETKSLGDILTDIVEQEVIAHVVKEKVSPLDYQPVGKEKALSPVTVQPQLLKDTATPIDLPEPFVEVEEKSEPPAPAVLVDKALQEDDSLSEKSDIPSPQFEPINLSVSLAEQLAEGRLATSPLAPSEEEKAPELQQPETAPSENEVKPPVEVDPSKTELKPIKLEAVEPEMPPPEVTVPPNESNGTRVEYLNMPDISSPRASENDAPVAEMEDSLKRSPTCPARLEVAEEVEVQTEPALEASDHESVNENAEEAEQQDAGQEEEEDEDNSQDASECAAEEAKEIKIRLKRYERQQGEKYMIVSNCGKPVRRASSSGERISLSKRKRTNKTLPDEDEERILRIRRNNVAESNAKKEVVLKKIFERYRGDETENDHRRNSNNEGVPLGHNIESINTPPPTPPSHSPPPALESNAQPRGAEPSNSHGRRSKSSHTLSSYLTESSEMIQEFRKHVNMPTEVEIGSNSLALLYDYLTERKDDRAMEEINKIMPFLNAQRRRFDSCSLPSKRRTRKHSSSEINEDSASGVSKIKMRRKTICADSHYMLSTPDFDEDICSSSKAADSPTAEVMRLHSSNRVGVFKKFSKVSETVTGPTEDVNEGPQDDLDTNDLPPMDIQSSEHPTSGCSSQSLASSSPPLTSSTSTATATATASATPTMSSSPLPSLPSSKSHKSASSSSKTAKSGDPYSDQERSRKQSKRAKCESPPDIERTVVVSRTYSKSNMVQHVFVPPEIEKCIEEEAASTIVESTKPADAAKRATSSPAPPTPPATASSCSSSSSADGAETEATITVTASTSSGASASKKSSSRNNAGSSNKTRKIRRIVDFPDTDEEDDNDDSNDEDFNYEEEIKELNRSIASSGGKRSRKKSQARKRKTKHSSNRS